MLRVADIMTPDPKTLEPTNSVNTAIRLMLEYGFHHIPIVEDGRLVGILHSSDIRRSLGMAALPENAPELPNVWDAVPIRNLMQIVRQHVTPQTPVHEAIEIMRTWALTGLPVLEEDTLVGMVTTTDILRVMGELLATLEERPTPPALAIVGKAGSGKTTLIEHLVRVLQERGYKLGVVKHHHHPTYVDQEGKDTWRYEQVGASPVSIVSQVQTAIFLQTEREIPLDLVISRYYNTVDIVLIEGYRWSDKPKIEVHREARSSTLLCGTDELIALVSDTHWDVPCPLFHPDDVKGIADFIISRFLEASGEHNSVLQQPAETRGDEE